jgi:hypothetical protein
LVTSMWALHMVGPTCQWLKVRKSQDWQVRGSGSMTTTFPYVVTLVLVPPVPSSANGPFSGIPAHAPTMTTLWSRVHVMASSWFLTMTGRNSLISAIRVPANVPPYRCFVIMSMAYHYQIEKLSLPVSTNIVNLENIGYSTLSGQGMMNLLVPQLFSTSLKLDPVSRGP